MEQKDLISIVIPAYNRAHCIGRTIESCLAQSYANIEIIICDDNSTDATVTVVEQYVKRDNRVILIKDDLGKGAQYARECGIRKSKGQYIAFLDSDDFLTKTSIEDRYRCFLENDIDMVYGDVFVDTESSDTIAKFDNLNNLSVSERKKYMLEELSLCPFITIMVKKEIFIDDRVILDKRLPAWQDDDLALSVVFYSGKIFHCGLPVAIVCVAGDNISAHYKNKYLGLKILFEKYRNQIYEISKYRVFLWKERIFRDYLGVKSQNSKNRFSKAFYIFNLKILTKILSYNFRHIYG